MKKAPWYEPLVDAVDAVRRALTWKGWRAHLVDNPCSVEDVRTKGWKLHRCADGEQCRASIPGGCAAGWCAHFEVRPWEGLHTDPRFPRSKVVPLIRHG